MIPFIFIAVLNTHFLYIRSCFIKTKTEDGPKIRKEIGNLPRPTFCGLRIRNGKIKKLIQPHLA